jgi:hypothetical protein
VVRGTDEAILGSRGTNELSNERNEGVESEFVAIALKVDEHGRGDLTTGGSVRGGLERGGERTTSTSDCTAPTAATTTTTTTAAATTAAARPLAVARRLLLLRVACALCIV